MKAANTDAEKLLDISREITEKASIPIRHKSVAMENYMVSISQKVGLVRFLVQLI